MSKCAHHWTVTSECPRCLRDENTVLVERLRSLRKAAEDFWIQEGHLCKGEDSCEALCAEMNEAASLIFDYDKKAL